MHIKRETYWRNGEMFVRFTQPFTRHPLRHAPRLGLEPQGKRSTMQLVAENNWLRRFLYWIGAARRMTRAV